MNHQETVPLFGSEEPKWPRVSLGNNKDAFIFLTSLIYSLSLPASAEPGDAPGGLWGLRCAAVVIGCMLACVEPS